MHKGMRRKLKVYAVDAAMIFLAFQLTAVIKGGKMEIAAMPSQGVVLEEREEIQIPEGWGEPETETHDTSGSLIKSRDWSAEDAEILLKIAMAEAEGESVEGKALVMLVVLNRVWSEGFRIVFRSSIPGRAVHSDRGRREVLEHGTGCRML